MVVKNKLMQKIGLMVTNLSCEFIKYDKEERIPTVAALSEEYETARGTVQSALKFLQDYEAIKLESRGHLGTYITYINHIKLLELAGVQSLVGVMPLPYSKRYEGLATGVYNTLNNSGIITNLAFMRGSNTRLKALKDGRYDFAIMSRLTAEYYIKNGEKIRILSSFGKSSYLSEHIIIVGNNFTGRFKDGDKIGIDESSIDQSELTKAYFKNQNVEYVPLSYSQFISALKSGEIDGAIWNLDDIEERIEKINYIRLDRNIIEFEDTEAVIVAKEDNNIISKIFEKNLDKNQVLEYQDKVLNKKIMPQY